MNGTTAQTTNKGERNITVSPNSCERLAWRRERATGGEVRGSEVLRAPRVRRIEKTSSEPLTYRGCVVM